MPSPLYGNAGRLQRFTTEQMELGDGSASAPIYTFGSDPDSGLFSGGTGIVGLSADGLEVIRFQAPGGADPQLILPLGSAANPTIEFGTTGSGFWSAGSQILVTYGGSSRWAFGSNTFNATNGGGNSISTQAVASYLILAGRQDHATTSTFPSVGVQQYSSLPFIGANISQKLLKATAVVNQTGTSAFSAFQVDVTNTALGSGAQYLADFQVAGVTVAAITNGTTAATQGRLLVGDGAVGTPSLSFVNSPTSGIYRRAADQIGIALAGADKWGFSGDILQALQSNMTIQAANGGRINIRAQNATLTGANPGLQIDNNLAFTASSLVQTLMLVRGPINQTGTAGASLLAIDAYQNTALGSGAQYLLDARVAGTTVAGITNGATAATQGRLLAGDGAAATPSLSFIAQPNTGIFRNGTSSIAFSHAGTTSWVTSVSRITGTGSTSVEIGSSTSTTARFSVFGSQTSGITDPSLTLYNFFTWNGTAAGMQRAVKIQNTVNQVTSSSGFTALEIATTETSLGSGAQNFISGKGGVAASTETFAVRNTGVVLTANGAIGSPTYSFLNDTDTGAYLPSDGIYGISTAGAERVRFTATNSTLTGNWLPEADNTRDLGAPGQRWANVYATTISGAFSGTFADGSVGAPSIAYTSDPNTGLWRPGNGMVGVSGDGLEVIRFQAPAGANPQALIPHGTTSNPSVAFAGNPDTGIFSPESLAPGIPGILFSVDGAFAGGFINEGTGVQFRTTAGTLAVPALSIDQSDQGFYSPGGNVTVAATEGAEVFRWQAPGGSNPQVLLADGVIGAPSLGFTGDTDSGLRWQSSGTFSFVSDGADSLAIGPTTITSARVVSIPVGAVGAVSLYFSTETNTGWYRSAANTWAMSISGTQRWAFSGDSFTSPRTAPIINTSGSNGVLSLRGNVTTGAGTAALTLMNGTAGTTAFTNAAAGTQALVRATATVNHTLATAGLGFALIEGNLTQTSVTGAGTYRLLDLQIAGTSVFHVTAGPTSASNTPGLARASAGVVGAPAYSWISDPDTGFYNVSADTIGVSLGGTYRWSFSGGSLAAQQSGASIRTTVANGQLGVIGNSTTATSPSITLGNDGQFTGSSGVQVHVDLPVSLAQSGTAGFTALQLGMSVTSTGSGTYRFIDAKVSSTSVAYLTNEGRWYVDDGSEPSPSYSFKNSTSSGMYYSANGVSISNAGFEIARFTRYGGLYSQVQHDDGNLFGPAISFISEPNSGLARLANEQFSAIVKEVEVAQFAATLGTEPQFLIADGTLTHPSLAFIGDLTTGIVAAGVLGVGGGLLMAQGGFAAGFVNTTGSDPQLITSAGTVTLPGLAIDQFDSGLYGPGGGNVGAVASGVEVFTWQAPGGADPQILAHAGWFTVPTYSFTIAPDTGMCLPSTTPNILGFAAAGQDVLRLRSSITSSLGTANLWDFSGTISQSSSAGFVGANFDIAQTSVGSGTKWLIGASFGGTYMFAVNSDGGVLATGTGTTKLAYSWMTDTDTGLHSPATNSIGVVLGGTEQALFSPTVFRSVLPIEMPVQSVPSTPSANNIRVYTTDAGGNYDHLRVINQYGRSFGMGAAPWDKNVTTLWGGNATVVAQNGLAMATAGSIAVVTPATTNRRTEMRGTTFASTATAGTSGTIVSGTLCFLGSTAGRGGFFFNTRFAFVTLPANRRFFTGLYAGSSAITNVNPSTLVSMIGVGFDSADTNLQLMCNDGAGTASKVNLTTIGAPSTTEYYDLFLHSPADGLSDVHWTVIRSDGVTESGTLTADLPATSTVLRFHHFINNGTTASIAQSVFSSMYCETDR